MVIDKNGNFTICLPGGILGISSNSVEKWFDIWCDYFYFSVATRQPCIKENTKEYVPSYLYIVNPFNKRFTKVLYCGKFILLIEVDNYGRN